MLKIQTTKAFSQWPIVFCSIAVILFYVPFAARFFMGDDWLWIGNAIRATENPSILFERPIYGYFRPLSLTLFSFFTSIAGTTPLFFGALNVVLHALNVILLYRVLEAFAVEHKLALLACFLFAFYYLNAPVVAWISTAPDLGVTALSLLVLLAVRRHVESPSIIRFLIIVTIAIAAVLIKESGIVTAGLYFLVLLANRQNPWNKKWLVYSLALTVICAAYLLFYFQGRSVVDKELVFGPHVFINLWYLTVYTFFPLSNRIADMLPEQFHWVLTIIKLTLTLALPAMIWYVFRKGEVWTKIFLGWLLLFVLTVSFFKWDVSLLTHYPERSASRYMYTPGLGTVVIGAWLLNSFWSWWPGLRTYRRRLIILMAGLYIAANAVIIYKVTAIYRFKQAQEKQIYNSLVRYCKTSSLELVNIHVPDFSVAPAVITSEKFLEAMLFVGTGREVDVDLEQQAFYFPEISGADAALCLG